jgi:uncharacterized Zn finger protein
MPRNRDLGARTWWGLRWLSALDRLDEEYQGRISRGRGYARNGSVQAFTIQPGRIQARVRGSYWEDYTVRIEVPVLADRVWHAVFAAVAGEATYVARLLAGELPDDLPDIFERAGAPLFPSPGAMTPSCTCLDWGNPCKHVIALHYVFAMRLDMDPSLLLTLRGRTAQQMTAALRSQWFAEVSGGPIDAPIGAEAEETTVPLRAAGFFSAGDALESFDVAFAAPEMDGALLQRLGKPPFAGATEDPLPQLLRAYQKVTDAALRAAARTRPRKRSRSPGGRAE